MTTPTPALSLLGILLFCSTSTNLAAQVFVNAAAGGADDGTSWVNGYTDLQDALANTSSGQIWVAAGTYRPITCNPCDDADRQVAFNLPPGVQLFGGFDGTESSLSERDYLANPTILSGDIGLPGDSLDNAYKILFAEDATASTVLDGFIVEEGNADGSFGFSSGAGLYLDAQDGGTAHIQVRNCTFRNNYAGGGAAVAIDCVLGGASEALFRNCLFEANTASLEVVSSGGAVFMQGNSGARLTPRFVSCTFRANYCGNDGGAFSAPPTGVGSLLAFEIDSCLFLANRADDRGGAVWYRMSSEGTSNVMIKNSRFVDNQGGGQGGALFARSSFGNVASDTLLNCYFSGNGTDGGSSINEGEGGAVFIRSSQDADRNHYLINCVFDRNHAGERGGALGTTSFVSGAGTLNTFLINCTFHGNTTNGDGGAIHAEGGEGLNMLSITNSILWRDSTATDGQEIANNGATITMSYTNIDGGLPTGVTDGGNNLDLDPMFANPAGGDLHLPSCSPLINAGDNGAVLPVADPDPDGDPRVYDGTVDLGAYETGVIYVDDTAVGANTGRSWADAFTDLQDGIAQAQAGDQVWVAEGIYQPTTCTVCTDEDRQTAFRIRGDVEVYGGFNATETDLDQRDWSVHETILSGDIGIVGDSLDNSYKIIIAEDVSDKTILDGLVVEEGNANGSFGFSSGAGLYVDAENGRKGNLHVRNCTFRDNYAGGGGAVGITCVLGGESKAEFRDCRFLRNTASLQVVSSGGAVFIQGNAGAQIAPRFVGCTFQDNYCGNDGGAFSATPTGEGSLLAFVIDSCQFVGNRADDRGGAVWYRMSSSGESRCVIKNSVFRDNQAGGQGGALFARSSFDNVATDTIANCRFIGNATDGSSSVNEGEGGAVFLRGSQNGVRNQAIINCLFANNSAAARGGAIGTTANAAGAGTLNASVINCTFYGNATAGDGGALHAEASDGGGGDITVRNSIFWNHAAGGGGTAFFNNGAELSVAYSDTETPLPPEVTDGGNNFSEDPQFLDPDNDDFRISSCSPARDAGLNAALPLDAIDVDGDGITTETIEIDLAGSPRIFSDTIDLGAYEWNGDPPELTLTIDATDVSCAGNEDGQATIIPAGGVPALEYEWSNGQSSAAVSGLAAGIYYVTVTDQGACRLVDSVTIAEMPAITLSASNDTTICAGETITLVAMPEGGDGDFLLSWDNGLGNGEQQTITPEETTTYTITAEDGNGCLAETTITVMVNPAPEVTISGSTTICPGGSTILDAGAAFTGYLWSDTSTEQTLEVTAAGAYAVTVTDANGCTATAELTVEESDALEPAIVGESSLCEGESTTLDAGVFDTYSWSTGESSQTIVVDTAGAYSVTVSDASGCTGADTLAVQVNPAPEVALSGSTTICPGGSTILDAGAAFTGYLWSDTSTEQTLEVTAAGAYAVTVTDANGCTATAELTVEESDALEPAIVGESSLCEGESTTLDAGVFDTYSWSTGESSQTIVVDTAGAYSVTVSDASGCTGADTLTVMVKPEPEVSILGFDVICPGDTNALVAPAGFASYRWSDGSTNATLEVMSVGTYGLTVTDEAGCEGFAVFTVMAASSGVAINDQFTVLPEDALPVQINLVANDLLPEGGWQVNIIHEPTAGEVVGFEDGLLTFLPAPEGGQATLSYELCALECPNQCTLGLLVISSMAVDINADVPNAFTPNGDGVNDTFRFGLLDSFAPTTFPDNELIVYNRWGDVIYQQTNYDNSWSGVNQRGRELPHGTYYYILYLNRAERLIIEGDVTIFR